MISDIFLLYFEFFKIGLFTIGGGLAAIPFINELSITYPTWITSEDISNMIAISQSTPGPLGVNMATFTGFKVAGVIGGIVASIALASPAFIIIMIVSKYLKHFNDKWYVKDAMYGIKSVVLALIIFAVSKIFIYTLFNIDFSIKYLELSLYLLFLILYKFIKIHPLYFIFAGALTGILFKLPT